LSSSIAVTSFCWTGVHAVKSRVQQRSKRIRAGRLIELRKGNWELAVFPVENRGFERAASWADEYKRILKLYEENLRVGKPGRATN
jgi:hypothetical protein